MDWTNRTDTQRAASIAAIVIGAVLLTGELWADILIPLALDETERRVRSPLFYGLWRFFSFSGDKGAVLLVFGALGYAHAKKQTGTQQERHRKRMRFVRSIFAIVLLVGGGYGLVVGVLVLLAPRGGINPVLFIGLLLLVAGYGLLFRSASWGRRLAWIAGWIMLVITGAISFASSFLWLKITGSCVFFALLLMHLRLSKRMCRKPRLLDGVVPQEETRIHSSE